jgi:hypothetical protein
LSFNNSAISNPLFIMFITVKRFLVLSVKKCPPQIEEGKVYRN